MTDQEITPCIPSHQCGDCGSCVDACICPDRDDDLDDIMGYSMSGEEFMANYLNSDSNINYLNGH